MAGEDSSWRKRGRIERRGNTLRVRVYAGEDPVTGKRVYRSETVQGTDRAAEKKAGKVLLIDASPAPDAIWPSLLAQCGYSNGLNVPVS